MSKLITGIVLMVALVALLPGCGKGGNGGEKTPAAAAPASEPHPLPATAYAAVDLSGIKKAEGGKTVAELYAGKDALAGQKVSVRGRVVKTRANIMDKNWLHLRDGTGAANSNDLTVTTKGPLPEVGATVLASGQVAANKDLGLGYKYEVLLEDAEVTVEQAPVRPAAKEGDDR